MRYGSLSMESLQSWALLNNVELPGARVAANILDHEGHSKGGGLVAARGLSGTDVALKIPNDMVLSRSQVEQCGKADSSLQELLEATATFAKVGTPRRVIGKR